MGTMHLPNDFKDFLRLQITQIFSDFFIIRVKPRYQCHP